MHSCQTADCVSRVTLAQVDQGPARHRAQQYQYLSAPPPGQPPKQHPAFLSVRNFEWRKTEICHFSSVNHLLMKFGVVFLLINS